MVELKFVQCWPPSKGSVFDANLRYTRCVRHMAVGGPVGGLGAWPKVCILQYEVRLSEIVRLIHRGVVKVHFNVIVI
jgi:hypothetical protein